MLKNEYVTTDDRCPVCGHALDRATAVEDAAGAPKPGDITVCIGCAEALSFGPDMRLRKATLQDLLELGDEGRRQVGAVQNAIRALPKK